jgi:ribonuclease HII
MLKANFQNKLLEAGCDEAGRGCLAGPVMAAAVIFPKKFRHKLLNDSKQLSEKERDLLRPIIEKEAIAYGVAMIDNEEIDSINILKASFMAMHKALDQLKKEPELLLIDGNRFIPYKNIPHQCIVEGDAKYLSIAAASVLAKTYRDEYMLELHRKHPEYEWKQNKGYATAFHRKIIAEIGITSYHRKSFRLLPDQMELTFDEGTC